MSKTAAPIQQSFADDAVAFSTRGLDASPGELASDRKCYHCGAAFLTGILRDDKGFCCQGCLTVFELLTESGLSGFYQFDQAAGIRGGANQTDRYRFVDDPPVRQQLVDFSDAHLTRVTFCIPAIHCIACVWLLEHLFRLKGGIGHSRVNFGRKELLVSFETSRVKLSEVIGLLASLGYDPELKLSDLGTPRKSIAPRRLWLQVGLAGFAFGNTMLFSLASYLGVDSSSGPAFQRLVGLISLFLAIPVVVYSASDYWRAAWISLQQRLLNIDVPIAAGIAALFIQSTYEVLSRQGEGYFDSLAGLLFFLLCGKLFQQKTFERLAFDRDYRSFFPLSITRLDGQGEEFVAVSQLKVDDVLRIRNGEIIPADCRVLSGAALIDYSFVTGESDPVLKEQGDYLYAGGRQIGPVLEVQTVKPVSQSYLTSLWNQDAFKKEVLSESLHTLTNRYSQRFTRIVLAIALGAAVFWAFAHPANSIKAFTSVLIVACPCALALAAPFTLGTAQRVLAKRGVYLKNPAVLETLAAADSIVFDKTGTLTTSGESIERHGAHLTDEEDRWVSSLARQSTHPLARRIARVCGASKLLQPVSAFVETPGCGIQGMVDGHEVWIGSLRWIQSQLGPLPEAGTGRKLIGSVETPSGSAVHLAIDKRHRGWFEIRNFIRPEIGKLMDVLSGQVELALLSGDNDLDEQRFRRLFGSDAKLRFDQSPLEKLEFVRHRQKAGRTVMMVGDGLNDAGALKQSNVGIAVVENLSAFSPASDIILSAEMVPQLADVMRFAKDSVRVVRVSFLISSLYNVLGIAIAAQGLLSPVVCAVLMPLSSITVVAFACGVTTWFGARRFHRQPIPARLDRMCTVPIRGASV